MYPEDAPRGEKFTWKEKAKTIPEFAWAIVIFLGVIGGLMTSFSRLQRAGSIGTAVVLLLAIFREKFKVKDLIKPTDEALRTACMMLVLVACSNVFGHFLTITDIPMRVAEWTATLAINRYIVLTFIMIIYLIGGSFIDDLAFMILATPVFYPIALKLGFDPIWFCIVIGVTMMIGIVIPPVAIGVFLVKQITGEPFKLIYSGVYPYLEGLSSAIAAFSVPRDSHTVAGLADGKTIRRTDMKITSIDIMELKPRNDKYWRPIVCRVNTDEGIYGYGEAALAYGVGASAAFGMIRTWPRTS